MPTVIAQISDFHCGSIHFVPEMFETVIQEVNALEPDLLAVTGDLTDMGFKREFEHAAELLSRIECPRRIVIPGNHDARNVGYVHFEELIGPRWQTLHLQQVTIVAEDSTEPDLDHGQIGRARYDWLKEQFSRPAEFRLFLLHHHLLPVPGTGRERNIVYDAGDLLEVLQECRVNLVLSGHKHVPYAWRLERLFVVNAGTCSSLRLRGNTKACYNIVRLEGDSVEVVRKYPFHGTETLIDFVPSTASFEKYICPVPEEEWR